MCDKKVNVALVIPKDFQQGGAQFYAPPIQASAIVNSWLLRINSWYKTNLGRTLTFDYNYVPTEKTIYELSLEGTESLLDAQGQGFCETRIWELLPAVFDLSGEAKTWAVVMGGGGWAGGRYDPITGKGGALLGDWGLYATALKKPNAGCLAHYQSDVCGDWQNAWKAWGHETLHSFGVACHTPVYISGGDTLTPAAKTQMYTAGRNYLK